MPFAFDQRMKLALMIGFIFCIIVSVASGWAQPWSAPFYWMPGFFIMLIISAAMGWRYPNAPWQSGRDIGIGEFVAMLIIDLIAARGFGLFPFGLVMMVVITLTLIVANFIGAYIRRARPAHIDPAIARDS